MAYSNKADLLTGNIPAPAYLDPDKFVSDAADEIDSYLGLMYVTPVDVSSNDPKKRPTRLLLQRVNNHLASGRLLQAADAGGQDKNLHAYAQRLIDGALMTLAALADGTAMLPGADQLPNDDGSARATAPLIKNVDEESGVEAFYDRIAVGPHYGGLGESRPRSPYGP